MIHHALRAPDAAPHEWQRDPVNMNRWLCSRCSSSFPSKADPFPKYDPKPPDPHMRSIAGGRLLTCDEVSVLSVLDE